MLKNQVIRASKVLDVIREHQWNVQQQAAGRAISGISKEESVDNGMVKTSTKAADNQLQAFSGGTLNNCTINITYNK